MSPWLEFAITLASAEFLIVLFYVPMAGLLLAIPFLLVAAPVACLQRTLLLRVFSAR